MDRALHGDGETETSYVASESSQEMAEKFKVTEDLTQGVFCPKPQA